MVAATETAAKADDTPRPPQQPLTWRRMPALLDDAEAEAATANANVKAKTSAAAGDLEAEAAVVAADM